MKHYHKNPRQITTKQFKDLRAWLDELGDLGGIVHDLNSNESIGGNMRLEAMGLMEATPMITERFDPPTKQGTVAIGYYQHNGEQYAYRAVRWTPEQCAKANVVANKAGGSWDFDTLANEFELDDLLEWGFEEADLQLDWGKDATPDPGAQVDKAAELQEKWGVTRGQVWQVGRHRVMCGDSTNAEDVARLMNGERAALCFTSPPYAQQRDYTDASDVSGWDGLMRGVFGQLPMTDDGQVLVNLGLVHQDREWQPYWERWIGWMHDNGWLRFGWYVWDRLCGLPGDHGGRLAPAHEFVFHFCRTPVSPNKNIATKNAGRVVHGHNRQKDGRLTKQTGWGDAVQPYRVQDSVFRAGAEKGAHGIDHPAVMSHNFAELVVNAYPGDIYDPFLGSGTTLVACEQTGRIGYGMEIEPKYVAVTLERLTGMGLEARLLTKITEGVT